jgi:hypothetical protein
MTFIQDNNLKPIMNVEELRAFMTKVGNETVDNDVLQWFAAYQQARIIQDGYSTKDLANILLEGIEKQSSNKAVQDYIDTFNEDALVNPDDEDAQLYRFRLHCQVYDFYGKFTEAVSLRDEIEDIE